MFDYMRRVALWSWPGKLCSGRGVSVAVFLTLSVAATRSAPLSTSPAAALEASETFNSIPQTSAAQALAFLNEQRAANGILGELANDPELDLGCEQLENLYNGEGKSEFEEGYPHKELEGAPGYTPLGAEAAARSDLGAPAGGWNATVNPWTDFPLHESSLFNPAVTTAWYGESHGRGLIGGVCMGTDGERAFPTPVYYSLPGDGATNVAPSETVEGEVPWSPGMAVGIPEGKRSGPNITLWPEGVKATLDGATLRDADGHAFAVREVTPETPAPPSPPGWPRDETVGLYSGVASFVIPVQPLAPDTPYTLTATWLSPSGAMQTQVVRFTTITNAQAQRERDVYANCPATDCAHGSLAFRTSDHKLVLTGSPAVAQRLVVEIDAGGYEVCVLPTRPCPVDAVKDFYRFHIVRTVRLRSSTAVIPLPARIRGGPLHIAASLPKFTALGYQWQPNTLVKTQR